ncbi:oxygenase MpaB family protein [Nocardia cyriacigeorgica]|uniref:oxygenase MpaB family protein n=1 Tax=Nocardia cyriacigeorgica TaxID=135487 RepID=UPI002458C96A|nr:oxygenase MpaB family protein [Nocardia cyriacigeorgica]
MTNPAVVKIPTSYRYFDNRSSAEGQAAARMAGLFVKGPLALPDEVARELGRDRGRADPLSDDFVEAAFSGHYSREVRKLVDQALGEGIDAVTDAPPELKALFDHLDTEPEWLDWDRVERGAKVFRRYGVDAFYYFGLISLDGYRREVIHKPLVLTGAYTGGSAFGRYLETCRFWLDISEPGALRQGEVGRRAAVLVRVMHSMIRHRIGPHPEWDSERLGAPLSQNAQFGPIILSFALSQHGKMIGYFSTDEEVLDHMHFWRYVAYLLGVEPAFFPETIDDWWRVVYLSQVMDDPSDGPDSRSLSQSFITAFGPADTDSREVRKWKRSEQARVLGWTRFFLNDAVFTANQLPLPGWRRWLPLTRLVPNLVDELCRRALPGYSTWLDARRRRQRASWLNRHTEGRAARFSPVETLAR